MAWAENVAKGNEPGHVRARWRAKSHRLPLPRPFTRDEIYRVACAAGLPEGHDRERFIKGLDSKENGGCRISHVIAETAFRMSLQIQQNGAWVLKNFTITHGVYDRLIDLVSACVLFSQPTPPTAKEIFHFARNGDPLVLAVEAEQLIDRAFEVTTLRELNVLAQRLGVPSFAKSGAADLAAYEKFLTKALHRIRQQHAEGEGVLRKSNNWLE